MIGGLAEILGTCSLIRASARTSDMLTTGWAVTSCATDCTCCSSCMAGREYECRWAVVSNSQHRSASGSETRLIFVSIQDLLHESTITTTISQFAKRKAWERSIYLLVMRVWEIHEGANSAVTFSRLFLRSCPSLWM